MLAAAAELFPGTRFQTPPERIAADSGVSAAGRIVRTFLGISDSSQLKAKDDFEALRLWGDALQRRGVYVSQRSLKDETIRAFSRIDGAHAVVVVDTGDTPYARIFSLLHEYVHIILRSTGICDLDDYSTVERLCNSVAAAALMPAGLVRSALGARAFTGVDAADDELLQDISRQLRVSQAALLVRLLELGKLSAQHFGDMEARRSSRRRDTERTPGGQYYPVRINRVGRRYARDVLGALDTGQIDRQDASSLLEIGEHLLPTYRQHLDNEASKG